MRTDRPARSARLVGLTSYGSTSTDPQERDGVRGHRRVLRQGDDRSHDVTRGPRSITAPILVTAGGDAPLPPRPLVRHLRGPFPRVSVGDCHATVIIAGHVTTDPDQREEYLGLFADLVAGPGTPTSLRATPASRPDAANVVPAKPSATASSSGSGTSSPTTTAPGTNSAATTTTAAPTPIAAGSARSSNSKPSAGPAHAAPKAPSPWNHPPPQPDLPQLPTGSARDGAAPRTPPRPQAGLTQVISLQGIGEPRPQGRGFLVRERSGRAWGAVRPRR